MELIVAITNRSEYGAPVGIFNTPEEALAYVQKECGYDDLSQLIPDGLLDEHASQEGYQLSRVVVDDIKVWLVSNEDDDAYEWEVFDSMVKALDHLIKDHNFSSDIFQLSEEDLRKRLEGAGYTLTEKVVK